MWDNQFDLFLRQRLNIDLVGLELVMLTKVGIKFIDSLPLPPKCWG